MKILIDLSGFGNPVYRDDVYGQQITDDIARALRSLIQRQIFDPDDRAQQGIYDRGSNVVGTVEVV